TSERAEKRTARTGGRRPAAGALAGTFRARHGTQRFLPQAVGSRGNARRDADPQRGQAHRRAIPPGKILRRMTLREYLAQQQKLVDAELDLLVPPETAPPETIHRAMRYSLFAGGKRIRPILCIEAARTVCDAPDGVAAAACSIELIHTYSLIHDDLPALDNDDYRRGKL